MLGKHRLPWESPLALQWKWTQSPWGQGPGVGGAIMEEAPLLGSLDWGLVGT